VNSNAQVWDPIWIGSFRKRLIQRLKLSPLFLAGLVGLAVLAGPAAALDDHENDAALSVRVFNLADASPAVTEKAEGEAGRIFAKAGVRVAWMNCVGGDSATNLRERCQRPLEADEIVLRILAGPSQNRFDDSSFGFAVVPIVATVYYDYVVRDAKRDAAEFEIPIVLGCIMAHEIGHLLLGTNSHSNSGLMQRTWKRGQIEQALRSGLCFSIEQGKAMEAEAKRRTRTEVATLRKKSDAAVR
jgi:hypothetical protein